MKKCPTCGTEWSNFKMTCCGEVLVKEEEVKKKCFVCGVELESTAKNAKYCPEHRGYQKHTDRNRCHQSVEKEFISRYGINPTHTMLEQFKAWKRGENAAYRNNALYRPFIEEL